MPSSTLDRRGNANVSCVSPRDGFGDGADNSGWAGTPPATGTPAADEAFRRSYSARSFPAGDNHGVQGKYGECEAMRMRHLSVGPDVGSARGASSATNVPFATG